MITSSANASRFAMSYTTLPASCYAEVEATAVATPRLLRVNEGLAADLDLSLEELTSADGVAVLSGNREMASVSSIAMAYAGHQFGNWNPSLGDGRALQIGEVTDRFGIRRGIQLKGAGPTPFSRGGDGRAALGPVLREYVLSEAMAALGVPTTRALAMVATGEAVAREETLPGAILTRVASGFVRVGTFQYFHAREMKEEIRALADFVIDHRFPDSRDAPNPYRALLDSVIACQADLIARWLLVGFIHGVMNTDNMSVMGETIDYGPCAFLDEYDPGKVFSSIDHAGRYAYDQQPGIGLWNLTRFAETLVPLLGDTEEAGIESVKDALARYAPAFQKHYEAGLHGKLGLGQPDDLSRSVVAGWMELLGAQGADMTNSFRALSQWAFEDDTSMGDARVRSGFREPEAFDQWASGWRERLDAVGRGSAARRGAMCEMNPAFIPRNHRIQEAIDAAVEEDRFDLFDDLLAVTTKPFEANSELAHFADPPQPEERVHQTFCGT